MQIHAPNGLLISSVCLLPQANSLLTQVSCSLSVSISSSSGGLVLLTRIFFPESKSEKADTHQQRGLAGSGIALNVCVTPLPPTMSLEKYKFPPADELVTAALPPFVTVVRPPTRFPVPIQLSPTKATKQLPPSRPRHCRHPAEEPAGWNQCFESQTECRLPAVLVIRKRQRHRTAGEKNGLGRKVGGYQIILCKLQRSC